MGSSFGAAYEFLFKVTTQGASELDKLVGTQKQLAAATDYSANAYKRMDEILGDTVAANQSMRKALEDVAKARKTEGEEVAALAKDLIKLDNERTRAADRESKERIRIAKQEQREMEQLRSQQMRGGAIALSQMGVPGVGRLGMMGMSPATMGGLGAGMAIGGIVDMAKQAGEQARELKNMADQMGLTISETLRFKTAAELTGQSMGSLDQVTRKLSEALENPGTTGKKSADALIKLGVSLTDTEGKVRPLGEVFKDLAAKLAVLTPSAENNALATV